jgi:cytochrome P450
VPAAYPLPLDPALDHIPEGDRLLAEEGPVVPARMADGTPVWLALSHRAVRQVLSDPRFSREAATRPGSPAIVPSAATPEAITSMDPPRHTGVRRLMVGAFGPRTAQRLEPRIRDLAAGLLAGLGNPGDLVAQYAEPLPIQVICELLGVPTEDRSRIRDWAGRLVAVTGYTPEEIAEAGRQIRAYLGDLVEAGRKEPDDALITELTRANDEQGLLTGPELLTNLTTLLVGGHETTVNQIGNALITLFRHRDQLELLRERPQLWPQAVEELLRHSMLLSTSMHRVTTGEVELDGVPLPAGAAVFPVLAVANKDPAAWPDPHRFDVTREGPAPHVSLGHGPHFCLGAQLARTELRIALATLVERFPRIAPAVDLDALPWKPGRASRALRELPVVW